MSSHSRRDFLKTSGLVAAGASVASLSIARSAHAAGDDVMKVALVGCGGRGRGAIENRLAIGDKVKIVAVHDPFENNARGVANMCKDKGHEIAPELVLSDFDGYKAAIDACDQVLLCASPGFRPQHYAYAIKQGKHVFMEKPCCTDAPGYRSLMETNKLADEKKLSVVVGLQRRHDPSYIDMIQRIWDGQIGDLSYSRVYWNGGGVWVRGRNADDTEMRYQMRNWYYFVWLCGDHICEQHVHNLDIGNWAASGGDLMKQHPVKANGMGGRQVRKGKDVGQIYDHHFVEFTMPDGSTMFSQCRHIPNCWDSVSEHIYGTKGKASMGRNTGVVNPYTGETMRNPYDIEHLNLALAIRNGGHINDGWHGAMSSFTAVLGRMATYSGKEITWDDAVAKGPAEMNYTDGMNWDTETPVKPGEDGTYEHAVAMPGRYNPFA